MGEVTGKGNGTGNGNDNGKGGRRTLLQVFGVAAAVMLIGGFLALAAVSQLLQGKPVIPERTEDDMTERFLDEARATFPDLDWTYRTGGTGGEITAGVEGSVADAGTVGGIAALMQDHDAEAAEDGRDFKGRMILDVGGVAVSLPHVIAPGDAKTIHGEVASGTWDAVEIHGPEENVFTARGCASDDPGCFDDAAESAAAMAAADVRADSGWPTGGSRVEIRIPAETMLEYTGGPTANEIPGRVVTAVIPNGLGGEPGAVRVRSAVELLGKTSVAGAPSATGVDGAADIVPGELVTGEDGRLSVRLDVRETGNDSMADEKQIETLRRIIGILREATGERDGGAGPGAAEPVIELSVTSFWSTVERDHFSVDSGTCAGDAGSPGPVENAVRNALGCG